MKFNLYVMEGKGGRRVKERKGLDNRKDQIGRKEWGEDIGEKMDGGQKEKRKKGEEKKQEVGSYPICFHGTSTVRCVCTSMRVEGEEKMQLSHRGEKKSTVVVRSIYTPNVSVVPLFLISSVTASSA